MVSCVSMSNQPPPPEAPRQGLDDTPTTSRGAPSQPDETPVAPIRLATHHPLHDIDPEKVGDFWLDSRLTATPAGTAYAAHEDGGDSVMLVLLSDGAAADAAARSRFSGEINAMHIDTVVARGGEGQDAGRMGVRFRGEKDDPAVEARPLAPWTALAFDGSLQAVEEADRVLHAVDLTLSPPLSKPSGPDYRLHWINQARPGPTRLWPLPWPAKRDRAGWISMLVAFLLMVLITALALLLAILVFQNQPIVNAPRPIPSEEPSSGSGSPSTSGSGSTQSSGSSGSGSPSDSTGGDPGPYSDSPSMNQPSGSNSGQGNPTVNPRL